MKTNENLVALVSELKKKSIVSKDRLWKRVASELESPTRQARVVNLSRIDRFTKDGDIVIVPGKVLASGELSHKLTIVAYKFSESAMEKIDGKKAKAMTIPELMKSDIKGKRVKILG
jgi:large subunit ribosomal protein L18e